MLVFEVCIFQKWSYTVAETQLGVKNCAAKTEFTFQKRHSAGVSHYVFSVSLYMVSGRWAFRRLC